MNAELAQKQYKTLTSVLDFQRALVGIKFLHTKDDFEQAPVSERKGKINYCVIVQMVATSGKAFKITSESLACPAGAAALGLTAPNPVQMSGVSSYKLGIYRDMPTSKHARDSIVYCSHLVYGVMVQPLEKYIQDGIEPDVVIAIANPYIIMRMIQGYSYNKGIRDYRMGGNQGVCAELTATPYMWNDVNVSLLCIGTRHAAHWHDDEMGIGFPFNLFGTITDGVTSTLNIMESDKNKKHIQEKLTENQVDDISIKYHCNYYMKTLCK